MTNTEKKCVCYYYSKMPPSSFPMLPVDSVFIENHADKLICKKCGRVITDDEIKEKSKKILPIVW